MEYKNRITRAKVAKTGGACTLLTSVCQCTLRRVLIPP